MKKISTIVLVLALAGAALAQNEKTKTRTAAFEGNDRLVAEALLKKQAEINEAWAAQAKDATRRLRAEKQLAADEQIVDVDLKAGGWVIAAIDSSKK